MQNITVHRPEIRARMSVADMLIFMATTVLLAIDLMFALVLSHKALRLCPYCRHRDLLQYANVRRPEYRTLNGLCQKDSTERFGQATQLPQMLVGASVGPDSKKKERSDTKTRFYTKLSGKGQNIQWYLQQVCLLHTLSHAHNIIQPPFQSPKHPQCVFVPLF